MVPANARCPSAAGSAWPGSSSITMYPWLALRAGSRYDVLARARGGPVPDTTGRKRSRDPPQLSA